MNEIFPLDARKHARRCGLLAGLIAELIVLIVCLVHGRFYSTTHVLITPSRPYQFGFGVPRLIDGLVIAILVTLVAYWYFRCDDLLWRLVTQKEREQKGKEAKSRYAEMPFGWGLAIGACGLAPVTPAGFLGILYATPGVLVLLVLCWACGVHWYQVLVCASIIILTIWAGETAILGSAAGTIYAATIALFTAGMVAAWAIALATIATVLYLVVGSGEYVLYEFLLPKQFHPDGLLLDGLIEWRHGRARKRAEAKHARANADKAA